MEVRADEQLADSGRSAVINNIVHYIGRILK